MTGNRCHPDGFVTCFGYICRCHRRRIRRAGKLLSGSAGGPTWKMPLGAEGEITHARNEKRFDVDRRVQFVPRLIGELPRRGAGDVDAVECVLSRICRPARRYVVRIRFTRSGSSRRCRAPRRLMPQRESLNRRSPICRCAGEPIQPDTSRLVAGDRAAVNCRTT
jgi:hypothetical protein